MGNAAFLTRATIKNYKSIAACDVELRALTVLAGPSGAGKSNFLDALRFVADGLRTSLDHAFRERGGIGEVRRRSGGHPTHFGVRLAFALPDASTGSYGFRIGARPNGFEVLSEECVVHPPEALADEERFAVAAPSGHLYLADAPGFRRVHEALAGMAFYSLNSERMKDLQSPDAGELLARDGGNLAAVLDRMARRNPEIKTRIEACLSKVLPGIQGVDVVPVGPRETLQFREEASGGEPWRFLAANVSEGALRALGILVALFQAGYAPLACIEEPEAGLHPAAAGALMEAVVEASAGRQALLTTHSPDLLDNPCLETGSILAVLPESGATRIGPLDAVGREALCRRLYSTGEFPPIFQPERTDGDGDSGQMQLLGESGEGGAGPQSEGA